jgi:DNA-directed RNA polymerase subunit beta'
MAHHAEVEQSGAEPAQAEDLIIGKLIPAATGLKRYRRIEIEPSEPLPRGIDDVGLLDSDNLAAELGLGDGVGFGTGLDQDLSDPERIGAGDGGSLTAFAEELAELDVPDEPSSAFVSLPWRGPAARRR